MFEFLKFKREILTRWGRGWGQKQWQSQSGKFGLENQSGKSGMSDKYFSTVDQWEVWVEKVFLVEDKVEKSILSLFF